MIDITGQRFGRLIVIRTQGKTKNRQWLWLCKCDCGNLKITSGTSLRRGTTLSCGCLQKEVAKNKNTTHGFSYSRTYQIWQGMIQRCENNATKYYYNYGGRGIKICDEWHVFENFLNDMGECPDKMTIDRKNNDGDYCKENCFWNSFINQCNNTRRNIYIMYKSKTQTLAEWARELKIEYNFFYKKIVKNYSVEEIIKEWQLKAHM